MNCREVLLVLSPTRISSNQVQDSKKMTCCASVSTERLSHENLHCSLPRKCAGNKYVDDKIHISKPASKVPLSLLISVGASSDVLVSITNESLSSFAFEMEMEHGQQTGALA